MAQPPVDDDGLAVKARAAAVWRFLTTTRMSLGPTLALAAILLAELLNEPGLILVLPWEQP